MPKTASRVLEITLTSRNKNVKTPIPMCGVPHRAAQSYIARLIDNGFKVAICDQIEDPADAKGLVKREVVRVITPGMIIDNEFLDEKTNNYVLALAILADAAGLSYLDISTGSFQVTEAQKTDAVIDAALSLNPSEILLPAFMQNDPSYAVILQTIGEIPVTYLEDRAFDYKQAYERLTDQFKTVSLEGFGCESLKAGIRAAGALVYYIRETQKQKIAHLTRLETYSLGNHLSIDEISWQNLEITRNIRSGTRRGTLLGIMDHTRTAMGARLLKNWLRYPLIQADGIHARLEAG